MIRNATTSDIPAMLGLFEELRQAIAAPQEIDRSYVAGHLAALMCTGGLALVTEGLDGFLIASVERSRVNPEPAAIEHGWFCRSGHGALLLRRYEAWAREQGCAVIRMTTGYEPGRPMMALQRMGYAPAEVAWVKRL